MPFFLFFSSLVFAHLLIITFSLSLSLSVPHHASLSLFPGIALYIKTCLEPHRIRTTHVPSTGLVSFLSCRYSSSFFLCLPHPMPFWGLLLVLMAVGGALSCLVLASCCLVLSRSELIDRPFPPWSHSLFPFLVYFVSLVSYSSTSKRRASLSHTCTTTKFDNSI